MTMRSDWRDDASCLGLPVEMFFPRGKVDPQVIKLCSGCPVKQRCLAEAMREEREAYKRYGVRGGLNARERDGLEAARKAGLF